VCIISRFLKDEAASAAIEDGPTAAGTSLAIINDCERIGRKAQRKIFLDHQSLT
jgi:Flp pilus assembly pilin Flp